MLNKIEILEHIRELHHELIKYAFSNVHTFKINSLQKNLTTFISYIQKEFYQKFSNLPVKLNSISMEFFTIDSTDLVCLTITTQPKDSVILSNESIVCEDSTVFQKNSAISV